MYALHTTLGVCMAVSRKTSARCVRGATKIVNNIPLCTVHARHGCAAISDSSHGEATHGK